MPDTMKTPPKPRWIKVTASRTPVRNARPRGRAPEEGDDRFPIKFKKLLGAGNRIHSVSRTSCENDGDIFHFIPSTTFHNYDV